jgi:hypothetical protein
LQFFVSNWWLSTSWIGVHWSKLLCAVLSFVFACKNFVSVFGCCNSVIMA